MTDDIEQVAGVRFGPGTLYGAITRLERPRPDPAHGQRRPPQPLPADGARREGRRARGWRACRRSRGSASGGWRARDLARCGSIRRRGGAATATRSPRCSRAAASRLRIAIDLDRRRDRRLAAPVRHTGRGCRGGHETRRGEDDAEQNHATRVRGRVWTERRPRPTSGRRQGVAVGGTLVLTLIWMAVRVRIDDNNYIDALSVLPLMIPFLFSMRYTNLKDRPASVQAVFIGGFSLLLTGVHARGRLAREPDLGNLGPGGPMFRFDAEKSVHFCDGMRRRDFLHAGSLALLGLSLRDLAILKAAGRVDTAKDVNCIMLMLVGGPSHLDTWDMKPEAPAEIRGPYKAMPTNVAGIQISEIFPRMAKHADKCALLRSVYHHGAGVHDVGHQMHADRALLPVRQRAAARRLRAQQAEGTEGRCAAARAAAAADRQHRRQSAARPERRVPRQDLRSVRAQRRPVRTGLQGPRPAAAGLPAADARRRPRSRCADGRQGRVARSRPSRTPACSTATFSQAYRTDVVTEGARGVRSVTGEPTRPRTATAATASA